MNLIKQLIASIVDARYEIVITLLLIIATAGVFTLLLSI